MAKGVILKTNEGTKLMGAFQCSNGSYFDADGCFKYCNDDESLIFNLHRANKLLSASTLISHESDAKDNKQWFLNRDNFIDVNIDYEINQKYVG